MVKVLQIDLFEKGGILPVTSEPIAVTATSEFVLVAFADGTITRYDTAEGKASDAPLPYPLPSSHFTCLSRRRLIYFDGWSHSVAILSEYFGSHDMSTPCNSPLFLLQFTTSPLPPPLPHSTDLFDYFPIK